MEKFKQPILYIGITFLSVFFCLSCSSYAGPGENPTIVKQFTLDEPGSLYVKTSGGSITVEGMSGNQIEVQVFVKKNGRLLDPDDKLVQDLYEGFDFKIEMQGTEITAYAKKLNRDLPWKYISVSFYISVPHQMTCDLNTSGGSIKLSAVEGMHNLNTSGGAINLNNVTGKTMAHTSGGRISVENHKGDIDLNTSGGGISVDDGMGNIRAHTSGGGINLNNINGEVDVNTSGGRIEINGSASYVKAHTSGGGIHVNITDLSKELYLDTSGGGIDVTIPDKLGMDLNLSANRVHIDLQNFTGNMKNNRINGTMNGGGIPVYMHTSGGNINVYFR